MNSLQITGSAGSFRSINKASLLISLGLLSAALIAFQLALMQILSIVQWYHFAYLVISVALMGFGTAGTFLALFRKWLMQHIHNVAPLLMIGCGVLMAVVLQLYQRDAIRFDSYLLFTGYPEMGKLALSCLVFFSPFFLGALAIGMLFDHFASVIGRIYFANLLGSGVGGLAFPLGAWFFLPAQMPALISIFPILAGILLIPVSPKKNQAISKSNLSTILKWICISFLSLSAPAWNLLHPPELELSQFKDLSKTMLLTDAKIHTQKTSPFGLLQTVSSPVLRFAPGSSLTSDKTVTANAAVFINGDGIGLLTGYRSGNLRDVLYHSSLALPYVLGERKQVLVLQSATGTAAMQALVNQAQRIVAVEPNKALVHAVAHEWLKETDSLYLDPRLSLHVVEPRTFLDTDTTRYDLVSFPLVGSFGGSSGVNALHEEWLLTRDAFIETWNRLNDDGIVSITAWMDYPARQPLKLLATIAEALEALNVPQAEDHIVAIRSWNTIGIALKKSPLTPKETQRVRDFCELMQFDPALMPGLQTGERNRYHKLQDSSFFDNLDSIFTSSRNALYEHYDFRISPATDDKPYFSQFIRWQSLHRLSTYFGSRTIPFFEIGYVLVMVSLLQAIFISTLLIIFPLFKLGSIGKGKWQVLLYFGALGLGYMFVEMVLIQRFIFYFGNTVYGGAAVLGIMLIFSGLGSLSSDRFSKSLRSFALVLGAIIILLLAHSFALHYMLKATVQVNLLFKSLIAILIIGPLAFFMGIPFPSGLKYLSKSNSQQVPWAWGINGCLSVISASLVTIIAVEAGFRWVMILAALIYCFPLLIWSKWK